MSNAANEHTGEKTFLERVLERGRKERVPLLGTVELTRRCPLACSHCYLGFDRNTPPDEELTGEELIGLFDQFRAEGCLFLAFTGGEPLLRKDFREIYLEALRKGFLVSIFSGGTLIDQDMADFFSRYPPFHIDITIPGATEKTFERITGRSGSFRQNRKAIELLAERGIPFGLKTVVSCLNRKELGKMKRFARQYGKNFRFDSQICPQLNGAPDNLRYRLDPREAIRLDLEDERKWGEWKDYICRSGDINDTGLLYSCGGGLTSFHVNSRGNLSLCVLDTNFSFDLRKGSFRKAWREFIPLVRTIRSEPDSPCRGCRLRIFCTNCPAWARLETGNPEKPVNYLCQIAGIRDKLMQNE